MHVMLSLTNEVKVPGGGGVLSVNSAIASGAYRLVITLSDMGVNLWPGNRTSWQPPIGLASAHTAYFRECGYPSEMLAHAHAQ